MKKLIALFLALVMVLSLGACTDTKKPAGSDKSGDRNSLIPASVKISDSDALKGKKIGCSIVYKGDEWCFALSQALEILGKEYGAEIVVEDGDLNDETQTKQIENMVANNCDILMIDPTTPDGTHEALMKAVEADIPIIIYDGYWTAGEEHAVTTVTWDQQQTGTMIGEYFVDYIKEHN
ncbi:MAG: sugar ABC transporter substrate-binding protein, partial [Clostridiales bacterium]|nr:sugar ABC transporter substrate-binding protein [Clostridiales bacterium]